MRLRRLWLTVASTALLGGLAMASACGETDFASSDPSPHSDDARGDDGDDEDETGDEIEPADVQPGNPAIGSDGSAAGNDPGVDIGSGATSTQTGVGIDTGDDTITATCEPPAGPLKSPMTLAGEDVPGNGLVGGPDAGHPGGSDFDDYALTLTGMLHVQSMPNLAVLVGNTDPTQINVTYARGTTDCAHNFTFIFRKCPERDSLELGRQQMPIGGASSGAIVLDAKYKDAYLDIVMTVTTGTGKKYGGCIMPFAVENHLYGSTLPAFVTP